ncbi:MAG: hypothetical protein HQL50_14425 [Magnetococcales bacterium]|nr:hypothetical protein [Magnetococcales bacterium]
MSDTPVNDALLPSTSPQEPAAPEMSDPAPTYTPEAVTDESASPASADNWREQLPEALRDDPSLNKFSSIESLAGSYKNLEQMLGRDKIPLPENDEEWQGVYDRLGRPEEPSQYVMPQIDLPPELTPDDDSLGALQETAHTLGLSQDQLSGLYGWYMQNQAELHSTVTQRNTLEHERGLNALRNEWQGGYDGRVRAAMRAVHEFGGDSIKQWFDQTGLGNDPRMIRLFAAIGEQLHGDRGLPAGMGRDHGDAALLKEQLAEVMANPGYFDASKPDHDALVKKAYQLRQQMAGEF